MAAANSDKDLEIIGILESVELSDGGRISPEVIEAVLEAAREKVIETTPAAPSIDVNTIEIAIQHEPDWRKRASLRAFLISKSLDI